MAKEYKFVRLVITSADKISEIINDWAKEGWQIVSHAEYRGEYTFVLIRFRDEKGVAKLV